MLLTSTHDLRFHWSSKYYFHRDIELQLQVLLFLSLLNIIVDFLHSAAGQQVKDRAEQQSLLGWRHCPRTRARQVYMRTEHSLPRSASRIDIHSDTWACRSPPLCAARRRSGGTPCSVMRTNAGTPIYLTADYLTVCYGRTDGVILRGGFFVVPNCAAGLVLVKRLGAA